uniref:Uncharacterized protein n=2 Tax=Cucumis sativus TaxID=3659 RepID=A0A0A0KRN9_CUCSA
MGIDPATHQPLKKQQTESSSQGSSTDSSVAITTPLSEANSTTKEQPLSSHIWMEALEDESWWNFPTWGSEIYSDFGLYSSEDSLNRLLDYYKELGDEDFELSSLGDFNKHLVSIAEKN